MCASMVDMQSPTAEMRRGNNIDDMFDGNQKYQVVAVGASTCRMRRCMGVFTEVSYVQLFM